MTTGSYWNQDNPDKPWGPLDVNEELDIPYDWRDWLTGEATTHASHTWTCDAGVETMIGFDNEAGGIITVRVRVTPALINSVVLGALYGITSHIVDSNGQKKDKTLYYKIKKN